MSSVDILSLAIDGNEKELAEEIRNRPHRVNEQNAVSLSIKNKHSYLLVIKIDGIGCLFVIIPYFQSRGIFDFSGNSRFLKSVSILLTGNIFYDLN